MSSYYCRVLTCVLSCHHTAVEYLPVYHVIILLQSIYLCTIMSSYYCRVLNLCMWKRRRTGRVSVGVIQEDDPLPLMAKSLKGVTRKLGVNVKKDLFKGIGELAIK